MIGKKVRYGFNLIIVIATYFGGKHMIYRRENFIYTSENMHSASVNYVVQAAACQVCR